MASAAAPVFQTMCEYCTICLISLTPVHSFDAINVDDELFVMLQSLMTGLMYNRPEDHIAYLQDCLKTLESERGDEPVPWNRFVVASKPLPAIPSEHQNGYYSASGHTMDCSQTSGAYFCYFAIKILK